MIEEEILRDTSSSATYLQVFSFLSLHLSLSAWSKSKCFHLETLFQTINSHLYLLNLAFP